MRKITAVILLIVMVMSSIVSFAAPGDIIHTGLRKSYRVNNGQEQDELLKDILKGEDVKKFYREVEEGKYVNIKKEEDRHLEYLSERLKRDGITNPVDIANYMRENSIELGEDFDRITKNISVTFNEIEDEGKGNLSDYIGVGAIPLLTSKDYSTPEPGYKDGTTKISTLNMPIGASRWYIKVLDKEEDSLNKDFQLTNGTPYSKNEDIEIESGKYLGLYATDRMDKVKAYTSIKITDKMVKKPREEAAKLEVGKLVKGNNIAGSVVIEGLDSNDKWKVVVLNDSLDKVYKDHNFTEAIDYVSGEDIIVVSGEDIDSIKDNFKKYVLVYSLDKDGKISGYNILEVTKNNLSLPPTKLIANTHYTGPIAGTEDGTTKFEKLNFGTIEATKWQILVSKNKINIPLMDSKFTGKDYVDGSNIEANPGDYLLLASVNDENKIKGYALFKLEETQIKGKAAPEFKISPEKGNAPQTTKVSDLDKVDGANKWMYITGKSLSDALLDKVYPGSKDYILGEDIKANPGDTLLILATDNDGKVKAFGKETLTIDMIKNSPPMVLELGVHYSNPKKGTDIGTTIFEVLSATTSIKDVDQWMYVVGKENFQIPESNGMVEGAKIIEAKKDIVVAEKDEFYSEEDFNKNLLLLATAKDGTGYKIKGYAFIKLNSENVKMPEAKKLKEGENYSAPIKGSMANAVKIENLSQVGIERFNQWRYKIIKEDIDVEYNSIVERSLSYGAGRDIRVEPGENILLLATDSNLKTKGYAVIEIKEDQIKNPNAPLLMINTNYTEPVPGSKNGSTKFGFLSFSTNITGATKWIYKIGDKTFGSIELDSKFEGTPYIKDSDIENVKVNDYLILLATDDNGQVKAYREFRLTDKNIRGGEVPVLTDVNYTLTTGSKPGTTKFSKLEFYGISGANRWKIKTLEKDLDPSEKPYLNSIVDDASFYTLGQDIQVNPVKDNDYGYILLLAVDGSSKTKGYAVVKVTSNEVKEHAPVLNLDINMGSEIDTVKIGTASDGKKYKIVLQDKPYAIPAKGDSATGEDYELGKNITVKVGQHLTIFEIDNNNKIQGYKTFEIKSDKIKQGSANFQDKKILEGGIVTGGETLEIKLVDAVWADLKGDKTIRDKFFSGFNADNQQGQWSKVINSLIADGSGALTINDKTLTISFPETKDYDIVEEQKITLTIPPEAIKGAINPIKASGTITIKPTVKATISGDVVKNTIRQKDIITGGNTIVIELADGNWEGNIDKDKLISGFQGGSGWDKIAKAINDNHVVRNSSKKVTITLPPVNVDFGTTKETVKLTIPKELIENAEEDVIAVPMFTLHPDILKVEGKVADGKDTVTMQAPDGKTVRPGMDTWVIEVTNSNLKEDLTDKDITITGLPSGLKTTVKRLDDKKMEIKVSGTSSNPIDKITIRIKIKGSAVAEQGSMDSNDIEVKIEKSVPMDLENVKYKIENNKIIFIGITDEMEYSINSTNGVNGTWTIGDSDVTIDKLEPVRLFVREKLQPKVYREVVNLNYEKAPEGIEISSVDYESTLGKAVVGLKNIVNTMEYSIDGGNNWTPISTSTDKITLDDKADLRVRLKAVVGESGSLPSQSTKRLNGLFLGNVALSVGEGKIKGTNTSMEYSLNSTNGTDGSWTAGKSNETLVQFSSGTTIWVREKGSSINIRKLGTVEQAAEPTLNSINYSIKDGKLMGVNNTLEYRIAEDKWISINGNEVTGVEFKPGKLEFRAKGSTTKLPSLPVEKATIKEPANPPEIKSIDDKDKKILYYDSTNKEWKNIDSTFEYKIGSNGDWKLGNVFDSDSEKDNNIMVYVRKAATTTELPSKEKGVSFTKNLTFDNVSVNVAGGYIEGTTTNMEYSINSTDGTDGNWKAASNEKTNVDFAPGMNVWIREKGKPSINKQILADLKREELPKLGSVYYNIGTKKISNQSNQNLEYRIGEDSWKRLDAQSDAYEVEFKAGKLEFRQRATETTLASLPEGKAVIKAAASGPVAEYDDVDNKITSIAYNPNTNGWKDFEYRINPKNDSPWISGELLATEDLSGDKIVEIRATATDKALPSQITKIEFTKNLELTHVILSTHTNPHELNGTTTDMEYIIYLTDNPPHGWIKCDNGNTVLPEWLKESIKLGTCSEIIIRDSRENQHENKHVVWKKD